MLRGVVWLWLAYKQVFTCIKLLQKIVVVEVCDQLQGKFVTSNKHIDFSSINIIIKFAFIPVDRICIQPLHLFKLFGYDVKNKLTIKQKLGTYLGL